MVTEFRDFILPLKTRGTIHFQTCFVKVIMKEIESLDALKNLLETTEEDLSNIAFQSIDLSPVADQLLKRSVTESIFMGCTIPETLSAHLAPGHNLVFPKMDVPFETYPARLYTRETIYSNYDPNDPASYQKTYDKIVYDHYNRTGKYAPESIYQTLARRLHDHSITDALMDIIDTVPEKNVVAVMGGHSLSRAGVDFFNIALLAKKLSEKNFFMLTGGGPGAMEATHLGYYFDGYTDSDLKEAAEILSRAPMYNDEGWLQKAFEVIGKYPRKNTKELDIGIPTWLYGHEPPTPFASKTAKYFANSVREEGLLALAKGGIIYTPGSAGTIQEIFQDATQNHYNSYGIISPMIFYNKQYWTEEKPVYPLLQKLSEGYEYNKLLSISNEIDEIIDQLEQFRNGE